MLRSISREWSCRKILYANMRQWFLRLPFAGLLLYILKKPGTSFWLVCTAAHDDLCVVLWWCLLLSVLAVDHWFFLHARLESVFGGVSRHPKSLGCGKGNDCRDNVMFLSLFEVLVSSLHPLKTCIDFDSVWVPLCWWHTVVDPRNKFQRS